MKIDPVTRHAVFRRRLGLTPLIDVIFLLLLFFMLTSTFNRPGALSVTAAQPGQSATQALPDLIVRVDGGGTLTLNGDRVEASDASAILTARREAGLERVAVTSGRAANVQDLVDALDVLAASGFEQIRVVPTSGAN